MTVRFLSAYATSKVQSKLHNEISSPKIKRRRRRKKKRRRKKSCLYSRILEVNAPLKYMKYGSVVTLFQTFSFCVLATQNTHKFWEITVETVDYHKHKWAVI